MKTTRAWDVISNKTPSTQKELLSILLENRGITTQKEEEKFLHPNLLDVSAKSVGIDEKQLQKTLKRIQEALDKKEQIIIFGDYDVDGITATAILWETLFSLSSTVAPYIPHRIDEGYGLSIKGVENVLEEFPQTKVIITVDNGIVAHEAVAFAKEKGIEVIITDHHAKAETLPDAFSIVHTTALCGAGVAWVLSEEIIKGKAFEKNP
ncbi:MAG TPA: DHH family phosphoesterase, partial [Patescibacteria group bacterium]|nr:DHH family phosphoesterase [Patescibacteria group bacterium]